MSICSIIGRISDLNEPLYQEELPNVLVSGDSDGDRFDITVVRGSEKVPLDGAAVSAYFIRIPLKTDESNSESGGEDHQEPGLSQEGTSSLTTESTVVISGVAEDNIASVTLPKSCYTDECRFSLVIKVTQSGQTHAIYICSGLVMRSSTTPYVDPGKNIPTIEDLLSYTETINAAVNKIEGLTVSAESGTVASVEKSIINGGLHFTFKIPNYSGGGGGGSGGTSETADRLTNSRKIALTGDVTGEVYFDGSQDVEIETTSHVTFDYEEITDSEVEEIWNG